MDHLADEPANAINRKGHSDIIQSLLEALSYQRKLPAFSRGRIYYDYDLGKIRIAEAEK